jgi:hypothetical protein
VLRVLNEIHSFAEARYKLLPDFDWFIAGFTEHLGVNCWPMSGLLKDQEWARENRIPEAYYQYTTIDPMTEASALVKHFASLSITGRKLAFSMIAAAVAAVPVDPPQSAPSADSER